MGVAVGSGATTVPYRVAITWTTPTIPTFAAAVGGVSDAVFGASRGVGGCDNILLSPVLHGEPRTAL